MTLQPIRSRCSLEIETTTTMNKKAKLIARFGVARLVFEPERRQRLVVCKVVDRPTGRQVARLDLQVRLELAASQPTNEGLDLI